jgi:general secretion pathway protein G
MFGSSSSSRPPSFLQRWGKRLFWLTLILALAGMLSAGKFNRYLKDSGGLEAAQTEVRIKFLSMQLEVMKRLTGSYPTQEEGLEKLSPDSLLKEKPDHVKKLLQDFWNRRIQYRYPGIHNPDSFDLYSLGADGIEGTEDDITNW